MADLNRTENLVHKMLEHGADVPYIASCLGIDEDAAMQIIASVKSKIRGFQGDIDSLRGSAGQPGNHRKPVSMAMLQRLRANVTRASNEDASGLPIETVRIHEAAGYPLERQVAQYMYPTDGFKPLSLHATAAKLKRRVGEVYRVLCNLHRKAGLPPPPPLPQLPQRSPPSRVRSLPPLPAGVNLRHLKLAARGPLEACVISVLYATGTPASLTIKEAADKLQIDPPNLLVVTINRLADRAKSLAARLEALGTGAPIRTIHHQERPSVPTEDEKLELTAVQVYILERRLEDPQPTFEQIGLELDLSRGTIRKEYHASLHEIGSMRSRNLDAKD